MKNLLMIIFCVGTGSLGQLSMKRGMKAVGEINAAQVLQKMSAAFVNPYVLAGLALYGISALVWMIVLSRVNLSYAYPMVSMGYVFVMIGSYYFFQEPVTMLRVLGTLVIVGGVILISQS
ncbi:MAG: EamA family transporter [Candidatus Eisenbacteria bacterium]|nr:EamA family transporter [Candidatus Eisenbacteria bacterium]